MNLKESLAAHKHLIDTPEKPLVEEKRIVGYRSKINSLRGYQCGNTILRPNPMGIYIPKTDDEVELVQLLIMEGVLEPVKE